jgi:polyisoprenoid-binding protein YceI
MGMSVRRLSLLFGMLVFAGSQPPRSVVPVVWADEKPAAAKTYTVDTGASRVFVKVGTATRLGHEHGIEGELKSGELTLGGPGELVFDMASFVADTAAARKRFSLEKKKLTASEAKKVNASMRGSAVLDIERHATASFKIRSIKPLDKQQVGSPGRYRLEGRFLLHGREQPLEIQAQVERTDKEGVLRMTGSFTMRQTDYGITPYSAAGGLARVADELEIAGELVLTPASSK